MGTTLLAGYRTATAQAIEEVIVTAQRREQSLQEVPVSVEAFGAAEIQRQGYRDLNELGTFSPSVYISSERAIEQDQSIRGFGTFGRNLTLEQAVPIFVDGIHFGRAAQIKLAFLDPARVEVLKGPQPVFFGMNATAGAFNIISAKPTPEWEGYLDTEVGNFDTRTVKGAIGGPLTDRLGIRVAGTYEDGAGYIHDAVTGGMAGAYENVGARVILEYQASDRLTLTGKVEYSKITRDNDFPTLCVSNGTLIYERGDEGTPARPGWQGSDGAIWAGPPQGVGWVQWPDSTPLPTNCADDIGDVGIAASEVVFATPADVRSQDTYYGSLDVRDAAAEWFRRSTHIGRIEDMTETLESPNGYFQLDYQMANDVQVTWQTGFSGMKRVNPTAQSVPFLVSTRERYEDFTQYSSELRFTSGPGRIEWMTGVLWQDTDLDILSNNVRANIVRGVRDNTGWEKQTWKTGFATVTFNFRDDKFSFDVGGRYTDLNKTAYLAQVSGSWVYDVNPCDPRANTVNGVPGTGDNDPATCPLHPDAIQITAADTLFLLPGADVNNLWQIPYRGDRYTPSSWTGGTGVQAVGLTTLVDNEGPDYLGRHNGPYTPDNGGNFSSTNFNPQVTFRYRPNDNHSLFLRYAESFKAGGFDTGVQSLPGNVDELRFEPESGWTIEVGSKGNIWNGRARYDATLFQTTFSDFQVQSATGQIENPFIAINAGEQRVRGLEMGLTAAASDRLTLSFAGALMDGEFTYFPGAGCNEWELRTADTGPCLTQGEADALNAAAGKIVAEAGTIDRTGTPTPKTPDWKFVFGVDWQTPIFQGYLFRLDAKGYVSDGYLTDTSGFDPTIKMDQHSDLNLTLGIGPQGGPWEVALYGRNLLEAKVTYHPEYDVLDDGLVSETLSRNNFATYGVKFRYSFFGSER
jgi:outer membrane receptor protein involved in Fe transport